MKKRRREIEPLALSKIDGAIRRIKEDEREKKRKVRAQKKRREKPTVTITPMPDVHPDSKFLQGFASKDFFRSTREIGEVSRTIHNCRLNDEIPVIVADARFYELKPRLEPLDNSKPWVTPLKVVER